MAVDPHARLSRRERQIMEIIYRLGPSTAQEIRANLKDPRSYSAVRALLRILEEKKHLRHRQDGPRYVFMPVVPRERARRYALRGVLRTFFDDSHEKLVAALLEDSGSDLSDDELQKLGRMMQVGEKRARVAGMPNQSVRT